MAREESEYVKHTDLGAKLVREKIRRKSQRVRQTRSSASVTEQKRNNEVDRKKYRRFIGAAQTDDNLTVEEEPRIYPQKATGDAQSRRQCVKRELMGIHGTNRKLTGPAASLSELELNSPKTGIRSILVYCIHHLVMVAAS